MGIQYSNGSFHFPFHGYPPIAPSNIRTIHNVEKKRRKYEFEVTVIEIQTIYLLELFTLKSALEICNTKTKRTCTIWMLMVKKSHR
jgi:hypothetical protein